jgi:superkiller protein 3
MDFEVSVRIRHVWPQAVACLLLSLLVCWQARAATGSGNPADRYYDQGVQSLRQEQWKSAVLSFEEVLKLDPGRADAENGMGVALGKLGDQTNSLAAFRRAIEIDPGYAEAHYNLALWLQVSGDVDQAISELTTAVKLRSDYEAAQFALASIFQDAGQTDKAVELFQTIIKEDPRSAEAHNWLGVAHAQKNQLLDAIAEFQQAVDIDPEYLDAYNNLASTFARVSRFDEAVRVFRSALVLAPQNAELHLNLSRALRGKGSLDAALNELRPLLKDNDSPDLECEIAEILKQKGDFKDAVAASEKALALRPGMPRAYQNLGLALQGDSARLITQQKVHQRHVPKRGAKDSYDAGSELLSKGEIQGAQKEFEKAVLADPNWAEAHNLLGFVTGQSGDLPGAISQLHKAVGLDPTLATAHYNLGVALWYGGQRSESIAELHTALQLDPALGEAYSFLGMACGQTGDLDGGRRYLNRAIGLNPDLPGPHIDLGIILLKTGQSKAAFEQFQSVVNEDGNIEQADRTPDLELAIDAVQQAIQQKSDDLLAYDTLGLLLGKAGRDPQVVIEQFRKAIQLSPSFAEAHNHLGMSLVQTGDEEAAAKEFREALRFNPNYAEAHANLGATLIANNDDEALGELERAISLRPNSIKAQYNLAMAYLQKYGVDKEIQQLQKVIAMDPKFAEAYYSLGKALVQKGQIQEAIPPLRQAISLDPMSGPAHYQLGLVLSRTDKTEEGKLELDKGLRLTANDESARKANALAAQAKLELDKGETQQAADDLGKVVQLMPDHAESHLALAQVLAKLNDVEGSLAEFKRALELQPNLYAAHFGLGQLLRRKGNPADAASEFREAVRLQPSSAEAYSELGLALNHEGDTIGAAAAFRKALEINPEDVAARENLDAILKKTAAPQTANSTPTGLPSLTPPLPAREPAPGTDGDDLDQIKNFEALIGQDKIDEVEPRVLAYLNDHPNSWRAHYIRGYVLFRMRTIGDSIRELAKALELNADNPEAHKILAKDFVVIGKWDYAQTELQQATRLKPESAEIHYSLGEVYSGRDMLREAKSEFTAAIQHDPSYFEAYNALGFTEESLGDDAAALAAYMKAMQIAEQKGSKFDAPYINVSEYYNRLNKPDPALEYARKAIALNSKSDLGYYQMARAYQSQGEWGRAAEALRNAISLNPSSAQYYYVLSQVYRSLGRQPESLAALKSFQELKHAEELVEDKMRENR